MCRCVCVGVCVGVYVCVCVCVRARARVSGHVSGSKSIRLQLIPFLSFPVQTKSNASFTHP